MSSEYQQLVQDTLAFLKEEHLFSLPPSQNVELPKKVPLKLLDPVKKKEKIEQPVTPKATPPVLIVDKIHKHLPRIKLVKKIPLPRKVAILAFNQEDLPFLKTLAKAIQERFCPVKLIDGKRLNPNEDWDAFTLVLSQEEISAKQKIIFAPIETYQNNTEQKKLLWSTICQHLSPKSS